MKLYKLFSDVCQHMLIRLIFKMKKILSTCAIYRYAVKAYELLKTFLHLWSISKVLQRTFNKYKSTEACVKMMCQKGE